MNPRILCAECAAESQHEDVSEIDEDGLRVQNGMKTDQIGWYVPAVPDERGVGYWGYTSIPEDALSWWKNLPTRPS